jgi:hypothetical protein
MPNRRAAAVLSALLSMAAYGCGGSTTQQETGQQSTDAGGDGGSTTGTKPDSGGNVDAAGPSCTPSNGTVASGYPAPHAPMPQVTYQGGGLLLNPEVVTVTFAGDTLAKQFEEYDDAILQSCWWDTVRAGYCESSGTNCIERGTVPSKAHVELTTSAASSYTDSQGGGTSSIQQFIQQEVANGTFPAPNANTLYALYFPSGTTITLSDTAQGTGTSCQVFAGFYHMSTTVTPPGGSNTVVSYAIIPRCSAAVADLTYVASHEITEAVTDPHVGENQVGFYLPLTQDALAWNVFGGEVGDLCVDQIGESLGAPDDRTTFTAGSTSYTVQRIWSNANAAASLDPCVPMPSNEVYFNVAPAEGSDAVTLSVGQSTTIELDAFSTGPMAAWSVAASDYAQVMGQTPVVQLSLSQVTAQNGDKLSLTITLASQPTTPVEQTGGGQLIYGEPYFIISAPAQKGPYHMWPAMVLAQ